MNSNYVWSANGDDLRIIDSDDITALDFFIEQWDQPSQTARIWVRIPSLEANETRRVYLYVGNVSATSSSTSANTVFLDPGIRFNTRQSTTNPNNKSAAFGAFNSANDNIAGYGCTFISNFTGINNRNQFGPPNQSTNFGALSESFFEVLPTEAGVWSFRYGADFGRGGGLYVDDVALEEQWNDDLWWASNWGASTEVLEGSINLTTGFHKIEIIGFEGCCDGGITAQYRRPGGSYQTFQTNTINIRSRKCTAAEPTVSFLPPSSNLPDFVLSKSVGVMVDPVNGTTSPKAIPGARMRYFVELSNTGPGANDDGSILVTDEIPPNTSLYTQGATPISFTDGASPSNLTFNYVSLSSLTDDVDFSNDGGVTYTYTPGIGANGSDPAVTHIRVSPGGAMSCGDNSITPQFTLSFDVIVD